MIPARVVAAAGILALGACRARTVALDIQTSLGTLTRLERTHRADSLNPAIAPPAGQVAVVLTFRGSTVVADYAVGWEPPFPLVDAQSRAYPPVLAGTRDSAGRVSQDTWWLRGHLRAPNGSDIRMDSAQLGTVRSMLGWGGDLTFTGTATVPAPGLTLAYLVPEAATGLGLKDGERVHPLPSP
jgi:hypothetical protein